MSQKPQARVQTSPSSRNVAVPRAKHSPRLGQRASSHTVWRPWERITFLTPWRLVEAQLTLADPLRRPQDGQACSLALRARPRARGSFPARGQQGDGAGGLVFGPVGAHAHAVDLSLGPRGREHHGVVPVLREAGRQRVRLVAGLERGRLDPDPSGRGRRTADLRSGGLLRRGGGRPRESGRPAGTFGLPGKRRLRRSAASRASSARRGSASRSRARAPCASRPPSARRFRRGGPRRRPPWASPWRQAPRHARARPRRRAPRRGRTRRPSGRGKRPRRARAEGPRRGPPPDAPSARSGSACGALPRGASVAWRPPAVSLAASALRASGLLSYKGACESGQPRQFTSRPSRF